MADYHIHSTYSVDGTSSPRSYVCLAEENLIDEIGFSEHVDLDPNLGGYQYLDSPAYIGTLEEVRRETSVLIRCGVEVSYQHYLEKPIKEYLSEIECDFVVGSIHEIDGKPMDHTFLEHFSPQEYFKEVENLIASGICDIVGHLEYFKRWGGRYSSTSFENDITSVLQKTIEKNLVLEVNTSGLRHPAQDTYPSFEVIKLYKELGGELISLGSDAHTAGDLAFQFPHVIERLKKEGFSTVATFCRRTLSLIEV